MEWSQVLGGMDRYFDKKGNPISLEMWAHLLNDSDYVSIASTEGVCRRVSTVWLGLDHSFGGVKPLIFETMLFKVSPAGEVDFSSIDCERYATEEEALEGHKRMCDQHIHLLDRIARELRKSDEVVDNPD